METNLPALLAAGFLLLVLGVVLWYAASATTFDSTAASVWI
jgi:hypothetical protein